MSRLAAVRRNDRVPRLIASVATLLAGLLTIVVVR
jgi:hypothetical protein